MLTGADLIRDIDQTSLSRGQFAFWWLGQLSFIVKMGDAVLYLDPFLTPSKSRTVPPLLKPEEAINATLIFGSHDHMDHIDRGVWPALAAASPAAKFVVPALLVERLSADLKIPTGRFIGLDDGKTIAHGGMTLHGIAAAHELLCPDPKTGQHPFLGFVIEWAGRRIYHAGDTCRYEGLETRLCRFGGFDAVFLPINGRDARRLASGCIGNMTYQEAVDLVGAIGTKLAVPAHYEMFKGNSEDPRNFVDYLKVKFPHIPACICRHGERIVNP